MILCEKPLAMNAEEGEEMCQAVEKAGVPNMVWYNYRRIPQLPWQSRLSILANWDGSSTTVLTFCRLDNQR